MATPSSYEIKNDNVGYVTIIGQDKKEYLIPAFMLPDFLQHFEANQIKHNLNASNASGSVSSSFIFRWRAYVYPADRASGRSRIRQIAHPADPAWSRFWQIVNINMILTILSKVHDINSLNFTTIGEGKIMAPVIPVS